MSRWGEFFRSPPRIAVLLFWFSLFFVFPAIAKAQCGAPLSTSISGSSLPDAVTVGLKIVQIPNGPQTFIWYPARGAEASYAYSKFLRGTVAFGGSPDGCQRYPLILFSHGFNGCATQSAFFTEQLARSGYIVAAPTHADAGCGTDGKIWAGLHLPEQSFLMPGRWNESTYGDRRRDLETVLDWILASPDFGPVIDASRIGAVGHSLGGYSTLAFAGAWESWRDSRIKAVLVFSPFVRPLIIHERLHGVHAPVMYQGAQLDLGITPSLRGPHGAFAASPGPKYYVELKGGSHLEWTDAVCLGRMNIASCIQHRANAGLIVEYGKAFFDSYLKDQPRDLRQLDGAGLHAFYHSDH